MFIQLEKWKLSIWGMGRCDKCNGLSLLVTEFIYFKMNKADMYKIQDTLCNKCFGYL